MSIKCAFYAEACDGQNKYILAMIRPDIGTMAISDMGEQQSIHGRIGNNAAKITKNRCAEIAEMAAVLAWNKCIRYEPKGMQAVLRMRVMG